MFVATAATVIGCVTLADQVSEKWAFLGILLWPVLVYAAVAIHEFGHWFGARSAGMTVFLAWIGPVQLKPMRQRMRVRWHWHRAKIHGAVMAFPDPNLPIRNQLMRMTVCGPGANLLAGLLFGAIGLEWLFTPVGLPLSGFAVLNLALAIGNMLPTERRLASDGLVFLRSLRLRDEENVPELIFMRLNGMAMQGVTADELPQAQVAKLEGMAMPMPLVHLWYSIKRHQHSAEWKQAVGLESRFDELLTGLPDASKRHMADFIASIRCELRFSRAMAGMPLGEPIDHGLGEDLNWLMPTLRPRCQALTAIREGKLDLARARLAESERWASQSIDLALERSEKLLRQAMLAELGSSA
jgi:hypothetical protein